LILSATLDENAVQTLVDIVSDLFPKVCEDWSAAKLDIPRDCNRELTKKQDSAFQELANGEDAVRCILHEAVVEEVMSSFPYVHRTVLRVIAC
jgi:hypothetical protein